MKSVAILGTRGYPSYYGGFETAVRRIAPYLADQGWRVLVYCRSTHGPELSSADDRVRRVITPGFEGRSLGTLSHGLTAAVHAALVKPDVVLVMNVANGYWLPLLRMRGIPTVVNVDGMEWEREKWGRLAKSVFVLGARLTARWAGTVIVDAAAIGEKWQTLFGRKSVRIAYGGEATEQLPAPLGLERRRYVLFVARLVPENSVQEFFDAVPLLAEKYDVVIVGSSGYQDHFDDLARSLARRFERVQWLGHLSDDRRLFSLWENAGAYFHGHSVGGTNPALVQAMACGAPIVARDTVYNREVLDGAGLLTKPTSKAIEASVAAIMKDSGLQNRLSGLARARATKSYSWRSVCESYDDTLEAARRNQSQ